MKAKKFSLRRDFAPDEAQGEDTTGVSPRELHLKSRLPYIPLNITNYICSWNKRSDLYTLYAIRLTRPTRPSTSITLIPWGWELSRVRIRSIVPIDSTPVAWFCFSTIITFIPGAKRFLVGNELLIDELYKITRGEKPRGLKIILSLLALNAIEGKM